MPSPFNHRPPPFAVEPFALGSGDIEAVEYASRIPGFPPAARSPLARPMHAQHPTAYRVPSPSPSLAPVAMNAIHDRADASGPQRASVETITMRSRPTMKMGFSILMASILFGGVLGITTRTRPANAAYEPSVETVLGANAAHDALPAKASADKDPNDAKADKAEASSDETTKEAAKPGAKKKRAAAFARTTVATSAPKPVKEKPEKAPKDDNDGYRVASASKDEEPAKPAKASKKAAKVQDDEDEAPPPPKAARTKPKASDDAANVLKAAMGATENTL